MITASHNPPIFNGFKLKSHFGGSAESATCQAVEKLLDRNPVRAKALADGVKARQIRIKDVRPAHYAALKRLVDFKLIAKSRLRFAHEALFGVGAGCFEELLAGTTCRVTTLNGAARRAVRRHQPGADPTELRAQLGVSQEAPARHLPGHRRRRRPRRRHGWPRQLSHHPPDHLPAAASFRRQPAGQGTGRQGPDHHLDGGQDVRGLRTGVDRDGRRLQVHRRRDDQRRRVARRGRERRHRVPWPYSRARRHRRGLDAAGTAGDRAGLGEQAHREPGQAIRAAPLWAH